MHPYEIVREETIPGSLEDFRALMHEIYELQPEFDEDSISLQVESTPSDYPKNMGRWQITSGGSFQQRGFVLARQLPNGTTKLQFAYHSEYQPIGAQFDVEFADYVVAQNAPEKDRPLIESFDKGKAEIDYHRAIQMADNNAEDASKVFVVHGRNEEARKAMFSFLRSLGLEPIEWNEAIALTDKTSPFIGEILNKAFSEAQAVLVLITGDDLARLGTRYAKSEKEVESLTPQARPNVLFEAGMAIGRNADRTILVQLGETRPFSDIAGRHIVYLDNTSEKRLEVVSRLKTAGYSMEIDHKTDWLSTGDFESCVVWPDKETNPDTSPNERELAIDTEESQWKRRYHLEDLKKQCELLLDFLGKPKSEFLTLQGVGNTWDENWRREKARTVQDWVEQHRPLFPKYVQEALTGVANLAGTMVHEDGMKMAQHPAAVEASQDKLGVIEKYAEEVKKNLLRG